MGKNRSADLFVAFACGALLGSAAAILMAPASGADTRRRVRVWGRVAKHRIGAGVKETGTRLRQEVEGIRDTARNEARRITDAVHEGAAAYRRSSREAPGAALRKEV